MANTPRKPREQYIYIGCEEEKFDINSIRETETSFLVPDDGRTYFLFHQREHAREQKIPKVIYAMFQFFGARDIRKDPLAELDRYAQVYAVDTSYDKGNEVAATAVSRLTPSREAELVKSWRFVRRTSKPEREGWAEFLRRREPAPMRRRCLVVDSELSELMRINRREEPILDDFFLPEGWQLNFASDKSADFILNKMIRLCDRESKAKRIGK